MAFLDKDGLDHLWSKITAKLSGKSDTGHGHSNATTSAAGFMSATDKSKLDGIATGAQKNTITGVKGNSESTYRTGNVNITAANIGLGNVNNTSDANKPVSTAQQAAIDEAEASALADAKSYADELNTAMDSRMDAAESKLSGIADGANKTTVDTALSSSSTNPVQNKVINSALSGKVPTSRTVNGKALSANISLTASDVGADASGSASSALDSAKAYADEAAAAVKNDLLNGAGTAYDTLKELGDLIDDNADAIDALETVAAGKANASHAHGNITNAGAIGTAANKAVITTTNGVLTTGTVPIASGGTGSTTAAGALTNLGITATASEINKLDGVTATTAEINYLDGVTSNIQAQLDSKAATHSHPYAGSSTQGGSATSAVKLDSSAGSATQPIWFENGKPKATTYALNKTVPSDAKFTDTTYSAATTSANGLMSSADKTKLNATNIAYGTCSTAAETAAKVITISGNSNWALTTGSIICVKFDATNTAENPTFNVNSTGAKSVWYGTAVLTTGSLGYAGTANRPCFYMYDGTQYVFLGWSYDANTTYTNVKLGHGYTTCSTAAATTAKTASLSSYTLVTGGIVAVKFTYDVPAGATLNINSKGAKAIYHKGAAITAGVIKAGDTATFIYSTRYHLISIDRDTYTKAEIDEALTDKSDTSHTHSNYASTVSTTGSGNAITAISQSGNTITATKGSTFLTSIPTASSSTLGGVKTGSNITNSSGTISLTKANVVAALGYTPPTTDTNTDTTYDLAASASATNGNVKLNLVAGGSGSGTDSVSIKGSGATTVTTDANGVITISSTDNNTTYTSLKNPYSLTIQGNGTTLTNGTYDGSAAKTVNITPASIGAAASSHSHDTYMTKAEPTGTGALSLNRKADTSIGYCAVSVGVNNTATGRAAHAEGEGTTASAQATHAEGYNTIASAYYGHAEGNTTTASNRAAHAEGGYTVASGQQSHAEGFQTIAASTSQHVQGKYNIEDTTDTYAHIVGNGSSSARANMHTLDWDGNAWYKGTLKVGGTSYADGQEVLSGTVKTSQIADGAVTASKLDPSLGLVSVSETEPTDGQVFLWIQV